MKLTLLFAMTTAALLIGPHGIAPAQGTNKSSDGVVKIGLLLDMSSIYAEITGTGSVIAAKLAIEDFGGKVLGKPIELVFADHQNKADIASAKAREWFDNDHVNALMEVAASATALAAIDIAKARNKLIVLNGPAALRITNEACSTISMHWVFDTFSLSHGTGEAIARQGYDSWFFITADYAFGHDLERDTAEVVRASGGKVLGSVRVPINTADFSAFLLQAQASKAKVVGLANAGVDTINSIKQAAEFGIVRGGQKIAGLLVFINDIHSLGLEVAQGMLVTEAFYWDMNEETRAFSKRFMERANKVPNMAQIGVYSATLHYLKAIAAVGTEETNAVNDKMRAMPVNDVFVKNGHIREDGRMVHEVYLFEVKKPSESKGPWDYYKLVATIPPDQAFLPLEKSKCPIIKKKTN
jgi:branched-chain amino acid transport system substrate-binding protein